MAIYNEILVGRYAKMLQRIFSIKGDVPTKQLAGEVMAVMPFFSGGENRFTEGWSLYAQNGGINGVATKFSTIQFRNPLGSNVVAVLQKVSVSGVAADFVLFSGSPVPSAELANVSQSPALDKRSNLFSSCKVSNDTLAAVGTLANVFVAINTINGQFYDIINSIESLEIPILPGITVRLSSTTAATNLQGGFWWRERPLEESETL